MRSIFLKSFVLVVFLLSFVAPASAVQLPSVTSTVCDSQGHTPLNGARVVVSFKGCDADLENTYEITTIEARTDACGKFTLPETEVNLSKPDHRLMGCDILVEAAGYDLFHGAVVNVKALPGFGGKFLYIIFKDAADPEPEADTWGGRMWHLFKVIRNSAFERAYPMALQRPIEMTLTGTGK